MGLEILIPLLWSVLAPVLTDLIKRSTVACGVKIPPTIVPAVGGAVGALAAAVLPELGMTEVMGLAAGLGGTGIHQMKNAGKYTRK